MREKRRGRERAAVLAFSGLVKAQKGYVLNLLFRCEAGVERSLGGSYAARAREETRLIRARP